MAVTGIDHVAFPMENAEAMLAFYKRLGFRVTGEDDWRAGKRRYVSLAFGNNRINLHAPEFWRDPAFTLRGPTAVPGCGDVCFVWSGTIESIQALLGEMGAAIEEGPASRPPSRQGVQGLTTSVYTRDPDRNLVEFMVYPE